jgi:hypothetical protein
MCHNCHQPLPSDATSATSATKKLEMFHQPRGFILYQGIHREEPRNPSILCSKAVDLVAHCGGGATDGRLEMVTPTDPDL